MQPNLTLTPEQKLQLTSSIADFRLWLVKTLGGTKIATYKKVSFPKPTRDDWIMWVDEAKGDVNFNSYVIGKCSFEYFEIIVIHECFHLFVQALPNKSDARMIKHGFGETTMKMLDIEADYFTALYYKQSKDANLVDILSLYAEGSRVFGDPRVLVPKLERFIGSILSITNLYFAYPNNTEVLENDLYLPTIAGVHTEDVLHVVISRNAHFLMAHIRANWQDFQNLAKAYTHTGDLTVKGYVGLLVRFCEKALERPAPAKIKKQISLLANS